MGVATPCQKNAMAPYNWRKIFARFDVFHVLRCHLFAFYKTAHAFTYYCNQFFFVETKKWLGLKLFY